MLICSLFLSNVNHAITVIQGATIENEIMTQRHVTTQDISTPQQITRVEPSTQG